MMRDDKETVLAQLTDEPRTIEELILATGLTRYNVIASLAWLENAIVGGRCGRATRTPDGYVRG